MNSTSSTVPLISPVPPQYGQGWSFDMGRILSVFIRQQDAGREAVGLGDDPNHIAKAGLVAAQDAPAFTQGRLIRFGVVVVEVAHSPRACLVKNSPGLCEERRSALSAPGVATT